MITNDPATTQLRLAEHILEIRPYVYEARCSYTIVLITKSGQQYRIRSVFKQIVIAKS